MDLIRGVSALKSDPLSFYIPFFCRKDTPSVYLSLTNGTPFVYLPLDYSTPFTYKLKQYSHTVCVRNILMKGLFKYLNDRFPRFPRQISCEIPTLSYTRSVQRVPHWDGASPYRPLYGVPPLGGNSNLPLTRSNVCQYVTSHVCQYLASQTKQS